MEEKVFLDAAGVRVTSARFVTRNQVFAMAAINTVKVSSSDVTPSNTVPGFLIAIGGVWLISAFAGSLGAFSFLTSTAILVVGIYWCRSIKRTLEHTLVLTTSSGETAALRSTDYDEILSVERAVNDAIIFRG